MDILLIIALSVVLGTLSLTLTVFIYYYLKLHSKFDELYKQNVYLKYHFSEKGLQKLNNAHEKSSKIIRDAILQAEEIIKKAELLKLDANKGFADELRQISQRQKEALKTQSDELQSAFLDAIKHLENEDINKFQNISKDIENIALNEIQKFEKQLHDETIGGQNIIDQKIQDAFAKANFEIQEYKKEKISQADKEVFQILKKISKQILRKQLNYDEHKALIMTALEDAKKEMIEA